MKRMAALWLLVCCLLLAGCAGEPELEMVWEMEQPDVLTLPDGETVDCWRSHTAGKVPVRAGYVDYRLSDGTVLLREHDPGRLLLPDGALDKQAAETVEGYYDAQGLLYEIDALLCEAYAVYQRKGEAFEPFFVEQTVCVTALSEGVVFCRTELMQSGEGRNAGTRSVSAIFDRSTGEPVSLWSLFRVPEDEARRVLLSGLPEDDPHEAAMLEAFGPEDVVFWNSTSEVWFPVGRLPGQELPTAVGVDMAGLVPYLQPWAVPFAEAEGGVP